MSAARTSQVTDEYGRPVPGASIYVSKLDGTDAVLTVDGTVPLTQPVQTDEFGAYTYYAPDGFYREDIWFGGKRRFRDATVPVGTTAVEFANNLAALAPHADDVGIVAANDANVTTVATNLGGSNTIGIVAGAIANVIAVGNAIAAVGTVSTNIANVNTAATNISSVNTVAGSIANVNLTGGSIANVNSVAGALTNISTVATNITNVGTVAGSIANVNLVGAGIANVNAVAAALTNVNAVAGALTNVGIVAGGLTDVSTVAANIAAVNTASTNISAILDAPNQATLAASAVIDMRATEGKTSSLILTQTVGGTTPNTTTSTSTTQYYSPSGSATKDSWLKLITIRQNGDTTYKVLVVDALSKVISETTVTLTGSGIITKNIGNVFVPAGGRPYFGYQSGTGFRYVSTGGSSLTFAASQYTGIPSVVVQAGSVLDIAFSYVLSYVDDAAAFTTTIGSLAPSGGTPSTTFVYLNGTTVDEDGYIGIVTTRFSLAGDYELMLVDRNSCVIWTSGTLTVAAAGLDQRDYSDTPMPSGARLGWHMITAKMTLSTGGNARRFAYSDYSGTLGDQVNLLFYDAVLGLSHAFTHLQRGSLEKRMEGEAVARAKADRINALGVCDERIVTAAAHVTALLTLTTTATLSRAGVEVALTDSARVFSAATGQRYDLLYYDSAAGTFGVIAGTDRTSDAAEFIPARTSPSQIPLFNVRVTPTELGVVPVWPILGGEDRRISLANRQEIDRSRQCLRKTRNRIRRGTAIRSLGFGNSITAIQTSSPSIATPNGTLRDRASTSTGYFINGGNIGSDVYNALPLYTSVQLGRADDGAGAVHTKVGWNWNLVAALQAVGYTLGTDLFYDNFGAGGTATTDAWSGGAPTAWLNAAVALAPNLVTLEFGMNELGVSTTEANMVSIIQTFQAAGAEVIVIGVPRKRTYTDYANWRYTHQALERAARYTNSAFLSMMPLYDHDRLGAIGLHYQDICNCNASNHPGILELNAIGRELTRLVVD